MESTTLTELPSAGGSSAEHGAVHTGPAKRPPPLELQGWWRVAGGVGLAAAIVAGIVLRFVTHSALWLDEALTVDIARLPLHDLHAALREDGAPPLYYVLLHFWIEIFGSSNLGVRSLSGVLSVATLPLAWLAGRRYGGKTVAWATLLLLATAPFAVYYATEARMYALVMFLTACGFLALDRAMHRARPGNLVAVAVVTGAALYTQYWALYLVATIGLWLLWECFREWRHRPDGDGAARSYNATWTLGAVVVGSLTFLPWLPTFLFQSAHTGTPWSSAPNLAAIITSIQNFAANQAAPAASSSNHVLLLFLLYLFLFVLGLFGLAWGRHHIDLDLRTRPGARIASWVVLGTLAMAVVGGILSGSAFAPRYASVVFVPLLLVIALGCTTFAAPKLRAAVLVVAAVAGLIGAYDNIGTQRTQAPRVAQVLHAQAHPGDVVAFCPDQLGPDTARVIGGRGYRMIAYPRGNSPNLINWINYDQAVKASSPTRFADRLIREAHSDGGNHQIWLVWAPQYPGYGSRCSQIATTLQDTPGYATQQRLVANPIKYYESMYLYQYQPR